VQTGLRCVATLGGLLALLAMPAVTSAAGTEPETPASVSLLSLTERVYPVIDAPAQVGVSWCAPANPKCTPSTWWQERDQQHGDDLVQFSYLEPGLASESRYAEAVSLLSLWPEGQFLLHQAALHGVAVVSWPDAYNGNSLANYTPRFRLVRISTRFASSPTWLLSSILAHELKHAADDRAAVVNMDDTADCLAEERTAFTAQARFVNWLSERQHGLPTAGQARQGLEGDDLLLYRNVLTMSDPQEVEARLALLYANECGEFND
jgi:hypothetical protein